MKEIEGIKGIRQCLRDSVNTTKRAHLRKMQLHLLGFDPDVTDNNSLAFKHNDRYIKENLGGLSGSSNGFGTYDLITRTPDAYLRSNPILNNLRITLAQTRAVDLVPDWKGIPTDGIIATARKAWWEQRAQGIDGYGGWKDDLDRAFMDFAAIGMGFLRIGVCEYEDGDRVSPRYISPLNVMLDPYAPSMDESGMCSFITVMGLEEAEERFPDYDFDKPNAKQTYMSMEGVTTEGVQVVEYYHINDKDDAPGYVAFLNDDRGEVIEQSDNPFKFLPLGTFINFQPPGASMPVGLVEMQVYDAQEIQREEEEIRRKAKRDAQLAIHPALIHPDDLQAIADGEDPRYIRLQDDPALIQAGGTPIMEVPRVAVNQDRFAWLNMRQQSIDEKSGIGANAAGSPTDQGTTATEVNSINARLGAQSSFLSREFSRGYQSFAVKLGRAAAMYDTAPFVMNFQNTPIEFNGKVRELTSKAVWSGALNAVIGEEDLLLTDVNQKKDKAIAKAQMWLQAVSSPAAQMAPQATIMLGEALGITDPEKYLPAPPDPMAQMMEMAQGAPPQQ
jgi:hypothetical protein